MLKQSAPIETSIGRNSHDKSLKECDNMQGMINQQDLDLHQDEVESEQANLLGDDTLLWL